MAEERTYKAEKYTPDAPAGTEPWDTPEPRYRIISTETGEMLDDVKGSWGPDDRFDAKLVRQLLKDNDLEPDFTAGELLRVWRNM